MSDPTIKANDGLQSLVTGAGTAADKNTWQRWSMAGGVLAMDVSQIDAAYRTNWIVRKVHDIPVFDMTRQWRNWQAKDTKIEALEAAERDLNVRAKVAKALLMAKLRGGSAIIMGLPGDPRSPAPEVIGLGQLAYIHTVTRQELSFSEVETDLRNPNFGRPKMFMLNKVMQDIHPSRIIPFFGMPIPTDQMINSEIEFWGAPLLESINDAMMDAASVQGDVARLVKEAKIDIYKIPRFMENMGTAEYEARFLRRVTLGNLAKSTMNALLMDSEEEYETKQISFTNLPEVVQTYLQIAAGAADIPLTRLLGTSAKGLNATGDGDRDNYDDMIRARQNTEERPALDRLDKYLVPSALGSTPEDVWWEFGALRQANPKEQADIEKTRAETVQIVATSGLVPDVALSKAVQNKMVEGGQWPGLEQALAEAEAAGELPPVLEEPSEEDDLALESAQAEIDDPPRHAANDGVRDALTDDERKGIIERVVDFITGRKPIQDAKPRTLYVSRKLVNAAEFIAWAKGQGFTTTTPADELHVTVTFSRAAVDWMKMGENWSGDGNGNVTVEPGGARLVEPLGDKGAVVLLFNSSGLAWRHEEMMRNGASWDFPEYQPHVTITYDGKGVDLSKVEPYRGKLIFGPEIFAEVVEDWEKGVTET